MGCPRTNREETRPRPTTGSKDPSSPGLRQQPERCQSNHGITKKFPPAADMPGPACGTEAGSLLEALGTSS